MCSLRSEGRHLHPAADSSVDPDLLQVPGEVSQSSARSGARMLQEQKGSAVSALDLLSLLGLFPFYISIPSRSEHLFQNRLQDGCA
jgi:hypothetical protein